MEVATRKEARTRGLSTYFTGKPCPKGHIAVRRVNGQCRECRLEFSRQPHRREVARRHGLEYRAKRVNKERKLNGQREQNGLPVPARSVPDFCECCGKIPSGRFRNLALDHCHVSGKFRGWLCHKCNLAIGLLGDNIDGVLRAGSYLGKYS